MDFARTALAACLLLAASIPLRAQRPDSVTLRVRVVDSAGTAIPQADVVVSRGSLQVARRQTDNGGRVVLRIRQDSAAIVLAVRRVSFLPYRVTLSSRADDSLTVSVVMADLIVSLDTIAVTDRSSVKRRNYFIDSTSIATSGRTVFDGWDLLRKLRPRIAYGIPYVCPGVENVWINGRWIPPELVSIDEMALAREPSASAATPHLNASSPGITGREGAMSILASIHPEHIAQLTFRDCFDTAIAGLHSTNAVFIVLKNGFGFDPGRGSYDSKAVKKK